MYVQGILKANKQFGLFSQLFKSFRDNGASTEVIYSNMIGYLQSGVCSFKQRETSEKKQSVIDNQKN